MDESRIREMALAALLLFIAVITAIISYRLGETQARVVILQEQLEQCKAEKQ